MHNAIKGESGTIEINGKSYPLIFGFNEIAQIETKYDETILEVQARMPRVDVVLDLLEAAIKDFEGDIRNNENEVPAILEIQKLIQLALHLAYFGTTTPKETEAEEKIETEKKK